MDGLILPSAPWREAAGLARLVTALGPGQARLVGGAVRDTLLGIATADIDLATLHPPERVIGLLEAAGIKTIPTGIKHGTITAVADDGVYEVTTLRADVDTDGRHATVRFSTDWREDAARRDFTINALYADPANGAVIDYFGGIADLGARRVRFIGDPLTRIAEDHLRILRFFRFTARFAEQFDAEGLAACAARANDLMALSRERIASELLRLLVAPRAPAVVALIIAHGIVRPVLPEITDAAPLERLAASEAASGVAPDAVRRLAALLPADARIAEEVGARLKLSNAQRKRLVSATGPAEGEPHPLGYRLGPDLAIDRLLLAGRDPSTLVGWVPPRLPITGGRLVELGLASGPAVARGLRMVEERWVAEGFPDIDRVEALARAAVAQLREATSRV